MIASEQLQQLTCELGFKFDPNCSNIADSSGRGYEGAVVEDVNKNQLLRFTSVNESSRQYMKSTGYLPHEDYIQHGLFTVDSDQFDGPDKKSLHGLIEGRNGYIKLDAQQGGGLYSFDVINSAEGANIVSRVLGRIPGEDIPFFKINDNPLSDGSSTSGQITEAIADMKILVPGINDFLMAKHDLGPGFANHGYSWPGTHPLVYKYLSRLAADTVQKYGSRLHYSTFGEWLDRPSMVLKIGHALDSLASLLSRPDELLAMAEHEIRLKNTSCFIARSYPLELLYNIENIIQEESDTVAESLLVAPAGVTVEEKQSRGYWVGVQLVSGLVETRLALHEVHPHPKATDAQTLLTLDVLSNVKKELDGQLANNKQYAFPA